MFNGITKWHEFESLLGGSSKFIKEREKNIQKGEKNTH